MSKRMDEIQSRLNSIEDMELMRLELNKILDEELAKPESELDTALVDELLQMLEPEVPTPAEKETCWKEIEAKLGKPRRRSLTVLKRAAAIAAVIAVTFTAALGTAQAFRWTFLLKLVAPLAETFGVYSTSFLETESTTPGEYTDEPTEYAQIQYNTPDQMPAEHEGLRLIPGWVPERFSFVQGTLYEDPDMTNASATYLSDDGCITLTIMFLQDDDVSYYEYERTLDEQDKQSTTSQGVTYYHNRNGERASASWIYQNAHYYIGADVTEDELRNIIESLL